VGSLASHITPLYQIKINLSTPHLFWIPKFSERKFW